MSEEINLLKSLIRGQEKYREKEDDSMLNGTCAKEVEKPRQEPVARVDFWERYYSMKITDVPVIRTVYYF